MIKRPTAGAITVNRTPKQSIHNKFVEWYLGDKPFIYSDQYKPSETEETVQKVINRPFCYTTMNHSIDLIITNPSDESKTEKQIEFLESKRFINAQKPLKASLKVVFEQVISKSKLIDGMMFEYVLHTNRKKSALKDIQWGLRVTEPLRKKCYRSSRPLPHTGSKNKPSENVLKAIDVRCQELIDDLKRMQNDGITSQKTKINYEVLKRGYKKIRGQVKEYFESNNKLNEMNKFMDPQKGAYGTIRSFKGDISLIIASPNIKVISEYSRGQKILGSPHPNAKYEVFAKTTGKIHIAYAWEGLKQVANYPIHL